MVNLWFIYGLLHGFASQETKVQVQLKLLWRMFRTFKVCITLQSRASSWSLTDEVTAKSDSQTPWVYWQCSKGGGASLYWEMLTVNGPYCVPKSVVCALYHCRIGYLRNKTRMWHAKIERGLWFGLSLSLSMMVKTGGSSVDNRWFLGWRSSNEPRLLIYHYAAKVHEFREQILSLWRGESEVPQEVRGTEWAG